MQNDEGFDWSVMFEGAIACFAKVEEEALEYESENTASSGEDVSVADNVEEEEFVETVSEAAEKVGNQDAVEEQVKEEVIAESREQNCMHHTFMAKVTEV